MENKTKLKLFICKGWQLGLNDFLVYCYLIYQDRFNTQPPNTRIAMNTGLDANTVARSKARLEEAGLLKGNRPVIAGSDFERKISSGNTPNHVSDTFLYWTAYIKAEHGPLTVSDCCIWSYLRSKHLERFEPHTGWSWSYIAKVMSLDVATVKKSFANLQDASLLEYDSGSGLNMSIRVNPDDDHKKCFRDKGQKSGSGGTLKALDDDNGGSRNGIDVTPVMSQNRDSYCRFTVIQYCDQVGVKYNLISSEAEDIFHSTGLTSLESAKHAIRKYHDNEQKRK